MTTAMVIFFWTTLGLIIYTYIGFPLLLGIRALLFSRPYNTGAIAPFVSFIVPAYNEEKHIKKKIDNLLSLNHPSDAWEAIIASDGSTDFTVPIIQEFHDRRIHCLALPRMGKNETLNSAMELAQGEIVVFTDADSIIAQDAINHLLAPFSDPEVGGVVGDVVYSNPHTGNKGEHTYWSFDRIIKKMQGIGGNVTSATGQLYAVRHEVLCKIPAGVIDDFYLSTQVVSRGFRLVFSPGAVALSESAESADHEFARKIRNLTIGFQGVVAMGHLLNPFRYGFYSLQLFTHKILRRIMGAPLIMLLAASLSLFRSGIIYRGVFVFLCLFLISAGMGFLLRRTGLARIRLFALPYYCVMVNYAAIIALVKVLRKRPVTSWVPQR